jgi:phosphoglucosamine mutase
VLSDFSTTGDGLIAALQVLAAVQESGRPASEVCHLFDSYPQILKNVRCGNGVSLDHKDVKSAIRDGENLLGDHGRIVIRKSGTEPLIRVMAEGDDAGIVEQAVNGVIDALEETSA